jgi:hypothetical protein
MVESPNPRPWWSYLSLAAALVGCCGGLGVLLTGLNGRAVGRTGGFGQWNPGWPQVIGVFAICIVALAGLTFAILGTRRGERPRALPILGFVGNGIALCSFLFAGISISGDLIVSASNKEESDKSLQFTKQQWERDRQNLRLRLAHEKPPDWLRLTHVTWKDPDTFHAFQKVGAPGKMTIGTLPPGITIQVDWPQPRRFQLTIDMDSKETSLNLEVVNIPDVSAERDFQPIALPLHVPPGKHQVVIKGRCP